MCIAAPLSASETTVLRAYSVGALPELESPDERVEWATATQALVGRGMLERAERGILVTPEGLAAALDVTRDDVRSDAQAIG